LFWREVALEGGYFEREVALQEGCFGGSLFRRKVVLEGEVVLKGSLFLKGHAFKSCGNFRKISRGFHRLQKQLGLLSFRGRAALQGRVKHMESIRASAPVVVFSVLTKVFPSLLRPRFT
jgi:hypothetical protein